MARQQSRFLALLRGINIGGRNIIAKGDLRGCFEDLGFTNVTTYIQSGNILFRSEQSRVVELTAAIEKAMADRFSYHAQAVVISHRKFKTAVQSAPRDWGEDEDHKHNALFTLGGITPSTVLKKLPSPKQEIERVKTGPGVIFWSISKKEQSKTTLMKLSKEPVYQELTVRNHNTVFKLLELFETIQEPHRGGEFSNLKY